MISYYHQLDPFLIQFSDNFGIRWYSLAYFFAAVFAYFAGLYLIKKGRIKLPSDRLMDIVVFGAIGAVVGGRLGYCVFYNPQLFLSFDSSFPFWGAIKVHQGGMSSHGGIIGLLISQILYVYLHKLSLFSLMDLSAFAGSVGIFLGRISNFINGELYGRIVEGKTWFAVRFPSELYLWAEQPSRYKEQLVSLKELLPTLNSLFSSSVRIPSSPTWKEWVLKSVEGGSIYDSNVFHICHLIVKNSSRPEIKELLEPLLFLRYPSQIFQSLMGGLLPFIIICLLWLKPRTAGLVSLVWLFCYLSFRIFTEFFRQPDPQIGFQFLNLTRGQWLSILLYSLVIAYAYAYFVYRKKDLENSI